MSQAEELLNSLSETAITHNHAVPDSDTHFLVNPYTREIENTNYQKTVLMRGDHNSERFTFEIPRYVDGHDMSLCNRVIVHFDNVDDVMENIHSDIAYMDDLRINPNNPETVISSWLIRREATQIVGHLSFSLQYQCVENDEITYEWNTDSYDGIEIRNSKNNGEAAVIQYTNLLEQWRSQIFGAGDSVMSNITNEGANQVTAVQNESASQQAAIQLKGSETLATIPDDYTEVYNMANEAVRTKADCVLCTAEGSSVSVPDASNDHVRGLTVYGKTTQTTTNGHQLFDATRLSSFSGGGVTITNNNDGSLTISGSGTMTANVARFVDYSHEETVKLLKPGMLYGSFMKTNPYVYAQIRNKDSTYFGLTHSRTSYEITQEVLDDPDLCLRIGIYGDSGGTIEGGTFKPILYQDGEGVYEPYSGGMASPCPEYPQNLVSIENPTVEICGENFARCHRDGSIPSVGLTVTQVNDSSELIINGTSTSATSVTVFRNICLPAGQYTLSVYGLNVSNTSYDRAYIMDESTNAVVNYVQPDRPQTFTTTQPKIISISIVFAEASVYNNQPVRFQLEKGAVSTEYKPYTGKRIALERVVPGIPVTSGGNYTDEKGQQWICDEVDLERGVYVQRIGDTTLTESLTYKINNYQLTSRGRYLYEYYPGNVINVEQDIPVISDKLISDKWGNFNNNETRSTVYGLSGRIAVHLADQTIQSVDAFKDYVRTNPIRVLYELATPVETPLSAEEIMAYKSLKTYYPNTVVLNDANAHMKVKYNADTKLYIAEMADSRATSLVEEVLNGKY